MNIREMAIEYIRKNPDCTSSQIAQGAGIPRRFIQPLMTELYLEEVVTRNVYQKHPFFYRLSCEADHSNLGKQYMQHRRNAEDLEKRQLWRRAAREWLAAMDATKDENARDKAAARREHCIDRGLMGINYDTPGLCEISIPITELWRDC